MDGRALSHEPARAAAARARSCVLTAALSAYYSIAAMGWRGPLHVRWLLRVCVAMLLSSGSHADCEAWCSDACEELNGDVRSCDAS